MPRGQKSKPGDKTVNANGYEYEKTKHRGWVGSHILVMERHLGRELQPGEYVQFKGKHDPPVTIDMLVLRRRGDFRTSIRSRIAQIETRIEELQAEKEILEKELNEPEEDLPDDGDGQRHDAVISRTPATY